MRQYFSISHTGLIIFLLPAFLLEFFLVFFKTGSVPYQPVSVEFSLESGTCPETAELKLTAPEGYTIRYTTNGYAPTMDSPEYSESLLISGSGNNWLDHDSAGKIRLKGSNKLNTSEELPDAWIIRAAAFAPDGTSGPVSTRTYFPGRDLVSEFNNIMVVSLVTDPDNLLDYNRGIMIKGRYFDRWAASPVGKKILNEKKWWMVQANYTQTGTKWERPVSVELFDGSNRLTGRMDGGLRVHGQASRMYMPKSLQIIFREEYGGKELDYDLFPEDGVTVSQSFVLRNGGNAAERFIFKDSWQQHLLRGNAFLTQEFRPVVLYLNGEYWGVYSMNDRYSEQYIRQHFGVSDVLICKDGVFQDGNKSAFDLYKQLLSYRNMDMSDPEIWAQFQEIMDVESMAYYYAAEIYMANYDFHSAQNIELWRSVMVEPGNPWADGRWRYMMYDTEYSSGLYGVLNTRPDANTLLTVISEHPLFASALNSPEFRKLFMTALKEIGSVYLSSERVNQTIDEWSALYRPLMNEHYLRFSDHEKDWNKDIAVVKDFYEKRYSYIIAYAEEMLPEP